MPLKQFEFEIGDGQFVPLLQQMLHYIQQHIALPVEKKERLLFETKVILTELLTNAIKHSGMGLVQFNIEINNGLLIITKTDKGPPLNLLSHPQLTLAGAELTITSDLMHTLLATLDAPQTLRFTCCEHALTAAPNPEQLHDHFGLLLITKIANKFCYHYNIEKKLNVFIINKRL